MLHTEMVCLSGNDRNLYLVISVAQSQNPIVNQKTLTHAKRLHTDTYMSSSSHTSITQVSVVSLTIQKRYAAGFYSALLPA